MDAITILSRTPLFSLLVFYSHSVFPPLYAVWRLLDPRWRTNPPLTRNKSKPFENTRVSWSTHFGHVLIPVPTVARVGRGGL